MKKLLMMLMAIVSSRENARFLDSHDSEDTALNVIEPELVLLGEDYFQTNNCSACIDDYDDTYYCSTAGIFGWPRDKKEGWCCGNYT